jgi:hypothetical protein
MAADVDDVVDLCCERQSDDEPRSLTNVSWRVGPCLHRMTFDIS